MDKRDVEKVGWRGESSTLLCAGDPKKNGSPISMVTIRPSTLDALLPYIQEERRMKLPSISDFRDGTCVTER